MGSVPSLQAEDVDPFLSKISKAFPWIQDIGGRIWTDPKTANLVVDRNDPERVVVTGLNYGNGLPPMSAVYEPGMYDGGTLKIEGKVNDGHPMLEVGGAIHYVLVPGNGSIYIMKRGVGYNWDKYTWDGRKFAVVDQPIRYVGKSYLARNTLELFTDTTYATLVGAVPEGGEITVIGFKGSDILCQTQLGLVGWYRAKNLYVHQSDIIGFGYEN